MMNLEKMTWTSKCPEKKILQLYLDDLLPDAHAWEIENHLLDCENCAVFVADEQEMEKKSVVNKLDNAFYGKLTVQNKSPHFVTDNPQSIDDLLQFFLQSAECMPIDAYELQIAESFRSASFTLIQPKENGVFVKNKITFQWHETEIETVSVIIENNQNKPLLRQTITNNSTLILDSNVFSNGLYYFKLVSNRTLLKLGKFYIF